MSILASFIVPHPPLIVPAVGRGEEKKIQATIDSYRAAAGEIACLRPDTVIVLSPHATTYADYFHISPGDSASGNLRQFGASAGLRAAYDTALVEEVGRLCAERGFPAGTSGEKNASLDHGAFIPMYFIQEAYPAARYIRVGISGLSLQEHYAFGMLLREAVGRIGRNVVIVASGDLSHKLTADGPYGYSPDGPKLDAALTDIMKTGNFGGFFKLDQTLCEGAAECGLRGFVVMAGALDQKAVTPKLHSYEGPFGVGYAVASFRVTGEDPARNFLSAAQRQYTDGVNAIRGREGPYTRLARETLERYVKTGRRLEPAGELPEEMTKRQAGVFVSIKKHGNLRGCIGTIAPTQKNIALEVVRNAVAAGTDDPRFSPVTASELPDLVYSVDVLSAAEPAPGRSALDVKRYGVIVSKGMRRGLLLPNLDGVDSVEKQLQIACEKAGISPSERYTMERFEVVRHT